MSFALLAKFDAAARQFYVVQGSAVSKLIPALVYIVKGKIDLGQLRKQMVFIGYECLPMVIALTALASMILTVNISVELNSRGGRELIGALISAADLREILPLFTAFAIAARCGTAITAEIASMKVTEQVDVLRVMKVDPIYYLLSPKLLATFLLGPLLVAIALITSLASGLFVAWASVGLEPVQFLEQAWRELSLKEYFYPLLKTEIFTLYAILTSVSYGLDCHGGAREVGIATTQATAMIMVAIIVLDGILTSILYT